VTQPVYVLVGADSFLQARFLAETTARVSPAATRAFTFDSFEGKGTSAAQILGAARTIPMMARERLVIVRDAELLGADGLAELVPYLEDPAPQTTLVLVFGKADGRWKVISLAKKKGYLLELETPRGLIPWMQEEARRLGAKLADDAGRRLIEIAGNDLARLAGAVAQLALFVDAGAVITAEDVDELVAGTRERTVFELSNAIGEGQRERALRAVASLFDQKESSVGVAIMVARHVRQLALAKQYAAEKTPRSELPRLVGAPPFAVDKLLDQSRRFTPQALERAMEILGRVDLELKGPVKGALGERIVVERLVTELLALGGTATSSPRRA
jgi:DNA polymerase-3 subunit delta